MLSVIFHEKRFNKMQFIFRTVKAPKTFLRNFSAKSPKHYAVKVMLMSQVSHFLKSVFIKSLILSSIILAINKEEISRNKYNRALAHEIIDGPTYSMQNKFSNCFVWVSPSTSDLTFHFLA